MMNKFLRLITVTTIGVIVVIVFGTFSYQQTYNQNCTDDDGKVTGFLQCARINEDFVKPESEEIDEQIKLGFGKTIQVNDLELYFYDIEDSRCPLDVVCFWEGKVTAMINVKNQTHKISGQFTPGYTVSYITPYNITLIDVQPHPISTQKPEYVATLTIKKLNN